MHTRRDFLKTATVLSGTAGLLGSLPLSIQKALAIDPAKGSTYLDAEHIVILMQENRSFDHAFGTLQGVRGYNDPRAITIPGNNAVWLQKNAKGETYTPFRLNIKDTKSTWIGSLPHSWTNQVDAGNHGKHDQWLEAKVSGNAAFAKAPLTMGYYNREDLPFYYSLADAFTICDQNFCSSLTGTTPNRLYLFSGTVREAPDANTHAKVRNEDVDYDAEANWKTFPERLEENNIPWKIYQNEISLDSGFEGEEDSWLSNFTDNPIEWFSQYQVRYSKSYQNYLQGLSHSLPEEIKALQEKIAAATGNAQEQAAAQKELNKKQELLQQVIKDRERWSEEKFGRLSHKEKSLHEKAFTTNRNDELYRQLTSIQYNDNGTEREIKIPKGDVLHQFRQDVQEGALPTVSWLVAPENFSDHPGAPWYGAWYVSEVMDILTQNPEVWKKTIFILCYDENDGYFDHIPPFASPDTRVEGNGKVSEGIDTSVEHVTLEQDLKRKPAAEARGSAIGLGYRVPLVIASPWSRGGSVCSQVFDHTSILQFMEKFLHHKTGKKITEDNISGWRRVVCGDLSSAFKPYNGEKIKLPSFVEKEPFLESVHKAQFRKDPFGYHPLTKDEIEQVNRDPSASALIPSQEKGIRGSCALPYQLYADGKLHPGTQQFEIQFEAGNKIFGPRSAGSPFTVYAPGKYAAKNNNGQGEYEESRSWAYAVVAGDRISDAWPLNDFEKNAYFLRVYGTNGFFREFRGDANDPAVGISLEYSPDSLKKQSLTGNVQFELVNEDPAKLLTVLIRDNAYKAGDYKKKLPAKNSPGNKAVVILDLGKSFGWYDFTVSIEGHPGFEKRYAGRVETGKAGYTDPAMGNK